jgi:hypothetical protein
LDIDLRTPCQGEIWRRMRGIILTGWIDMRRYLLVQVAIECLPPVGVWTI